MLAYPKRTVVTTTYFTNDPILGQSMRASSRLPYFYVNTTTLMRPLRTNMAIFSPGYTQQRTNAISFAVATRVCKERALREVRQ